MDRRNFIKSALYSGIFCGAGGAPRIINDAAASEAINNRILINTFLQGGPDMRSLVVPAVSNDTDSPGYLYWANRHRSHAIGNTISDWQQRFEEDYFPVTVGSGNWGNTGVSLADSGNKNGGQTFGIWKGAGWLIDKFLRGEAAFVFNSRTATNRAHDLAQLQLNQGNLDSLLSDTNRSGWGGRLARVSNGNVVSVTASPNSFGFGPIGSGTNFNPNAIDNSDLVSIANSRSIGLNGYDLERARPSQRDRADEKMARALGHYYASLERRRLDQAYQKAFDHEGSIRMVERIVNERIEPEVPALIRALREPVSIGGVPVNPGPGGTARAAIRGNADLALQIQNVYDVLTVNQSLNARTISLSTGIWDTHDSQRVNSSNTDLDDPLIPRGIETLIQDIFKGPYRDAPNNVHGGFSALQQALSQNNNANEDNLVYTFAGEFGRQIRDNGDGTDHGEGNMLIVVGNRVRGGLYGDMFPESEVDLYNSSPSLTASIQALTDMDHIFGNVCDWVQPNSGDRVFPRRVSGDAILESNVNLNTLLRG